MKTIAYAYPTSFTANAMKRNKTGCWVVEQPDKLHGPFDSLAAAEAFCDSVLAYVEYGYWTRRTDPANEPSKKS